MYSEVKSHSQNTEKEWTEVLKRSRTFLNLELFDPLFEVLAAVFRLLASRGFCDEKIVMYAPEFHEIHSAYQLLTITHSKISPNWRNIAIVV